MAKRINQLKTGVILSYINLAIGSIIPMIYTPIMLRILGQAEYGLYSLSSSIISYLSLLNFGMGSTIVRYVTKYKVEGNKNKEQEIVGLFFVIYFILSVLVLVGGVCLVRLSPSIFNEGLSENEILRLQILILIMSINTAFSFPMSVFSSIIISYERYIFSRSIDIILTILTPIVNLIVLYIGFKSIGMATSSVAIQLLIFPIMLLYCLKILKVIPKFTRPDYSLLNEILRFSLFIFIGSLVDMLFWSTDKVILGALAGTVTVAIYNVGSTFNSIVEKLSTTISGVLTPRITEMVVKGVDNIYLSELFIKIGRIQFIIIALVVSGFITFGRPFVVLWAGEGYEDSYIIALLTMIPLVVPLIQTVGRNIIIAQNKHQFRSIVYLCIAIINVISTYLIVPYMGGIGAALCSCISYIIGQGIIMNIYYSKVTKLDIYKFWYNIIRMSIIPFLLILLFRVGLYKIFNFYDIHIFLLGVLLYAFLYIVLMYSFIMNNYEKSIVNRPIKKIFNVIKK